MPLILKKATYLICVSLLAVGCQIKDNGEYNLETSAKDKTVAGRDENKDGVRDDVEAELKKQYTGKVLDAALKHARAMQGFLTVNQEDKEAMWKATMEVGRRVNCLFVVSGDSYIANTLVDDIRAYTINNDLRMDAYIASNNAASGGSYSHDDETLKCEED